MGSSKLIQKYWPYHFLAMDGCQLTQKCWPYHFLVRGSSQLIQGCWPCHFLANGRDPKIHPYLQLIRTAHCQVSPANRS